MRYIVPLALVVVLAGCETVRMPWQAPPPPPDLVEDVKTQGPEEGLEAATARRFPDVPLPSGLRASDRTWVYQSDTLRVGRMVYKSKHGAVELAQFFIKHCPEEGWELGPVVQADEITVKFTKSGELLGLTVRDLGMGRGREIELQLTPEGGQS